jgi:hypothetical protein
MYNPIITQEFITNFCRVPRDLDKVQKYTTRDVEKILTDWQQMKVYLDDQSIDWNIIHDHLCQYNYDAYRFTPYWLITRNYRYYLDGFGCHIKEINGCTCINHNSNFLNLECHHITYEFARREAHHLDCLKTLCHDCHQSISVVRVKKKEKSVLTGFNEKLLNIGKSIIGMPVVIDTRGIELEKLINQKPNVEQLSLLQQALIEIRFTRDMMQLMK